MCNLITWNNSHSVLENISIVREWRKEKRKLHELFSCLSCLQRLPGEVWELPSFQESSHSIHILIFDPFGIFTEQRAFNTDVIIPLFSHSYWHSIVEENQFLLKLSFPVEDISLRIILTNKLLFLLLVLVSSCSVLNSLKSELFCWGDQ